MNSVAIIGAGRVGSTVAYTLLLTRRVEKIYLIDIIEDKVKGESLDLSHAIASINKKIEIKGLKELSNVNEVPKVVVITAGVPRRPGMTRMDLLRDNVKVMSNIVNSLKNIGGEPVVIVVTNPIDPLTYYISKKLGYDWGRVLGFGNSLDTARLKHILARRLNTLSSNVSAIVIGEHGQHMVPLFSQVKVEGKPVKVENRDEIREELVKTAANVIKLKGGTWFGPAACISEVINAIIGDEKKLIPLSTDPLGEYYGYEGISIGIPLIIGREGALKVVELSMDEWEKKLFKEAYEYLLKIERSIGE